MRNKFLYFASISLMLVAFLSFTSEQETGDFTTKVYSRFLSFLDGFREEKVYLHTDKPYYSSGENIWFKGYLVNAATLKPESFSSFIYVELINLEDSVVSRVKILKDSTGFAGHIRLDQTLPTGNYNLRAYSQWMQNNSSDFFFTKNIFIGNRIEERVSIQTSYEALDDEDVLVKVRFIDENTNPVADEEIEISGHWPGTRRSRRTKLKLLTDSNGEVSFNFPIDLENQLHQPLDISLKTDDYNFETKLYLPDFSNDFDVQFFPESGVLLNRSGLQTIAFKAIGKDGLSREVAGKLYSQSDEELLDLKTQFNGMGKFLLNTTYDDGYYAILKTEKGVEKRFELPKLEDEGVSLQLNFHREKIYYSLTNQLKDHSTPLFLFVHSNGKPLAVSPVNNLVGSIGGLDSEVGIITFSIIDTIGNVYCERLFFRNELPPLNISMQTDQEVYGKRELVNLSFNVQSGLGQAPEGFFSVSVTDSRLVKPDTINDNIISHLLLSSDLKGHIENPTTYFTNDSALNHQNLDLLMLTQGWTRYNTSDILQDKKEQGEYYMEAGQTLSGKVLNVFGRPVKNCDVIGLVNSSFITTQTDSTGRYVFDGIGFHDSVTFLLKAERKKAILDVQIVPDMEVFPDPKGLLGIRNIEQRSIPNEYLDQNMMKFFNEGGIRHIYLDEFTVKASKKKSSRSSNSFGGMADNTVTSDDLERMRSWNITTILSTIPGVMVMGDKVTIRNNPGPPLLIIDGFSTTDFSDIRFLTVDDIEDIQVFKGATASFFGAGSSNGVIAIATKRGESSIAKTPISMATVSPLGVQKPEEFYIPKYEVQSVREDKIPDLRTTIYWNPALSSDTTGVVNVEFYTADPANNYSVVLEGVTQAGEICRYEGVVKRK